MSSKPNNLQDCVRDSVATFFNDLDGTEPANLYDMLVQAVEKPLPVRTPDNMSIIMAMA